MAHPVEARRLVAVTPQPPLKKQTDNKTKQKKQQEHIKAAQTNKWESKEKTKNYAQDRASAITVSQSRFVFDLQITLVQLRPTACGERVVIVHLKQDDERVVITVHNNGERTGSHKR